MGSPELIDEYSNCFFISVINVLNGIIAGEKLNKYQLADRIKSVLGDDCGYFSDDFMNDLITGSRFLLEADNDRCFRSRIDSPIEAGFSHNERIYLKTILQSKYAKLLMSDKMIDELLDTLKDVEPIELDRFYVSLPSISRKHGDGFTEKIRILLDAVRNNKEIVYSNNTGKENYINRHGFPIRIEYSVLYDMFHLSLWSSEEDRPVKININKMYDVGLTDGIWKEKKSPAEMLETRRCKEPVVIEMKIGDDSNNTFERIMLQFAVYDTRIVDMIDDKYRISISYYEFDKEVVLNQLFSFGPYIKVLSPDDVINNLIERIKLYSFNYI